MKASLAERASQNRLLAKEANISSECGCLFEKTAAQNICQGVFSLAGIGWLGHIICIPK